MHALSLAAVQRAVARHPQEASAYRKNCAKYALLRGIRKIASEVRARQRGQLTRNAYVRTLLSRFEEAEAPPVVEDASLLVRRRRRRC